MALRKRFIRGDKCVENPAFAGRKLVEPCLQTLLQIFQHEWNEADVSDLVFRKRLAHKLRPQRPQMHYGRPANERPEETNHEVDGVIRRQDAEVAHAWRKRIKGGESDALLEIILVRHHAAFGTAAGA